MKRTTVYLDAGLKRRLKSAARSKRASAGSIIRDALSQYLTSESGPKLRPVGHSHDGGVAWSVERTLRKLGFGRR